MNDKEGVPSSSGIDIIEGETESDQTPTVNACKENPEIYTRKNLTTCQQDVFATDL